MKKLHSLVINQSRVCFGSSAFTPVKLWSMFTMPHAFTLICSIVASFSRRSVLISKSGRLFMAESERGSARDTGTHNLRLKSICQHQSGAEQKWHHKSQEQPPFSKQNGPSRASFVHLLPLVPVEPKGKPGIC